MILWFVLFAAAYVLQLLYLMHMFQLNGYKPNEMKAWLDKNTAKLVRRAILPVLAAGLSLVPGIGWLLCALCWALAVVTTLRKTPAKKPLVYTARVIRMLATHAVLFVLVWALLFLVGTLAALAAAALYILLPLFILLVNALNAPIQKAINRHYVNEAKQKIRDMPNLTVVGITGSYGKTSVKFFLTDLLSARYNVLCTPRNFNTELGVTRTIREDLRPTHEVFVCEMGARYTKDIEVICDIVHPKYGIITAVGPQHLDTFGNIDNIIKTKFELYDSIPEDGCMYLNYDNAYIRSHQGTKKQVGFGRAEDADFRLLDLSMTSKGSRFSVGLPGGETAEFTTDLIGEYNILDVLAALSVAYSMGVTVQELQRKVRHLKPVQHRLQLLPKNGRISVIDDAYNSNINGFNGALDTLARFDAVKVIVTPGMVELGSRAYELNHEAGAHAARVCDYIFLVGREQTKPLQDAVREDTAFDQERLFVVDTLGDAWKIIPTLPGGDMVVLLENDLPDNY